MSNRNWLTTAALSAWVLSMSASAGMQSPAEPTRRLARVPAPVGALGASTELYTGSYALLVGVSRYDTPSAWSTLDSIPKELDDLESALRASGFEVVQQLRDPTGDELRRGVEAFIGKYGYVAGHRLVFFFSGHGYTLDKGTRGYFVPRDAPDPTVDEIAFRRTALSMQQVSTWAQDLVAKHALFSFDSCFSGTIFRTRDRPVPQRISEMTAKPVREFMSAGGAGEPVPARSVYTPVFIRGLKGAADLDQDGFVTGTELGNYVQREVIAYKTRQTPQFGKIRDPEFDEGDLVFAVPSAATASVPPAPTNPRPAARAGTYPGGATAPLGTRWAFAEAPTGERATALAPHLPSFLQQLRLGLLLSKMDAGLLWSRPEFEVTSQLNRRIDGGDVGDPTTLPSISRLGYANVQQIVNDSLVGKSFTAELQGLMNRGAPQAEITDRNNQLQQQFINTLTPLLDRLSRAAAIDIVLSANESGLVYANPAFDVSPALTALLDAKTSGRPDPPTVPIPALTRTVVMDAQRMASETVLGKQYRARVVALEQKKAEEVKANGAFFSAESPEMARYKEAAQKEVSDLMLSLTNDFQAKLLVVAEKYCKDRAIDVMFSVGGGRFTSDSALDITGDLVRAFDAAYTGRGTP